MQTFTANDDGLHRHLAGDEWWFTETAWFSYHHVERRLGGWFYTMIRPNIGTVAGGAWVWDDNAHLPWEALYSTNYSALELADDLDLRHAILPTGVRIEVEEPTMAYRIGYDDPGRYTADLRFEATMAPRPLVAEGSTFGKAAHFDQIGKVTGTIEIAGEQLAIDCWSMRDRTWGRRPEDRPRQAAYVTGAGEGGTGFLAVTNTRGGTDRIAYGFVNRGGGEVALVDGTRTVVRNPETGWVDEIRIEATDAAGEALAIVGRSVSRLVINRHSFIDLNSLIEWQVDLGSTAAGKTETARWWGEDQDMWPVHTWAAAKRSADWAVAP